MHNKQGPPSQQTGTFTCSHKQQTKTFTATILLHKAPPLHMHPTQSVSVGLVAEAEAPTIKQDPTRLHSTGQPRQTQTNNQQLNRAAGEVDG